MNKVLLYLPVLIAFSLLVFPTYAALNPDNIMGMWLFNEGNGDEAMDSSGNGNHGKINGGAKWVDGQFGKALEFDGTDDWVEVQHSNTLGFAKGQSFSITLHYNGSAVGGSLVGKGYEDTSEVRPWYLLWNGGGDRKVSIYLRSSAGANSKTDSTIDVADENWHFIAAIMDADAKKIALWIDGKMNIENNFDTSDSYGTNESVFHIARHFDRYTNGIIDDVGLFNVALTENEMKDIMDNGLEEAAAVDAVGKLTTTWGKIKRQIQ